MKRLLKGISDKTCAIKWTYLCKLPLKIPSPEVNSLHADLLKTKNSDSDIKSKKNQTVSTRKAPLQQPLCLSHDVTKHSHSRADARFNHQSDWPQSSFTEAAEVKCLAQGPLDHIYRSSRKCGSFIAQPGFPPVGLGTQSSWLLKRSGSHPFGLPP